MTAQAGGLVGGVIAPLPAAPYQTGRAGAIQLFVSGATAALAIYKNEGWYAAGSAWETWITSDAPATVPPSGHPLTFLQHVVVQ